jgi:hypothetical protein
MIVQPSRGTKEILLYGDNERQRTGPKRVASWGLFAMKRHIGKRQSLGLGRGYRTPEEGQLDKNCHFRVWVLSVRDGKWYSPKDISDLSRSTGTGRASPRFNPRSEMPQSV